MQDGDRVGAAINELSETSERKEVCVISGLL